MKRSGAACSSYDRSQGYRGPEGFVELAAERRPRTTTRKRSPNMPTSMT